MFFLSKKKYKLLLKKKRKSFQIFYKGGSSFFFKGFLGIMEYSFNFKNFKIFLEKKKTFFKIKSFFFFSKNLYSFKKTLQLIFIGCSFGWYSGLEFSGRGFSIYCNKNFLKFNIGYSHGIALIQPSELTIVNSKSSKNKIFLHSFNFFLLRNFSFKIRSLRTVDSYKGRGIKYDGEILNLKVGKRGI